MKHYNIPIFITHYGCPNMCVFCNQNKITGRETDIDPKDIPNIIDEYLLTLPLEGKKEVAFFGGTFTAISLELQEKFLKEVKNYIDKGLVDGIRLSTRPDNINREILELLKFYGVTTIELGVQSLDNKVLELSERGYKKEEVERASSLIKEYKIQLGIQLMPGLPGSSFESDLNSANAIVKLNPNMVRIYPTLVISNTKLELMYKRGEFKPLSIEDAVNLCAILIAKFEIKKIDIIRVGLQPSDEIREEGVILDGPFHPAFRELVESHMNKLFFNYLLKQENELHVLTNKFDISRVTGIKKSNKLYFKNKLKIELSEGVERGNMLINNKKYSREDILRHILGDI